MYNDINLYIYIEDYLEENSVINAKNTIFQHQSIIKTKKSS